MALKRLKAEKKKLDKSILIEEVVGFAVIPRENNELIWDVHMEGPVGTAYAGGVYMVELTFPAEYPFKPPVVKFQTKIWNPSIGEKGEICLELLTKWKPVIYVSNLLLALRSLLQEPSADGAVNNAAAEQYKNDRVKFEETVVDWKKRYAQ